MSEIKAKTEVSLAEIKTVINTARAEPVLQTTGMLLGILFSIILLFFHAHHRKISVGNNSVFDSHQFINLVFSPVGVFEALASAPPLTKIPQYFPVYSDLNDLFFSIIPLLFFSDE